MHDPPKYSSWSLLLISWVKFIPSFCSKCFQAIWFKLNENISNCVVVYFAGGRRCNWSNTLHWLWLCLICIKRRESHAKFYICCAKLLKSFKPLLWNVEIKALRPIRRSCWENTCAWLFSVVNCEIELRVKTQYDNAFHWFDSKINTFALN